ncbi:MAG: TonB family protein [Verrucomicrobiota bacterium]
MNVRWKVALLISLVVHCAAIPLAFHYSAEPPDMSGSGILFSIQSLEEVPSEREKLPSPEPVPRMVQKILPPPEIKPIQIAPKSELPQQIAEAVNVPSPVESISNTNPPPLSTIQIAPPPRQETSAQNYLSASAPSVVVNAAPRYRENRQPVYPPLARRKRQEGLVILNVVVNVKGAATKVEVKQGTGFALLDNAAVEAVRTWSFEPAKIDNRAIVSSVEIPISFKLSN